MIYYNTFSLHIKRVELNVTEKKVIEILDRSNFGRAKEVIFSSRKNEFGNVVYNSALVNFDYVYHNQTSKNLITEMMNSRDGIAKFYYNRNFDSKSYWIVQLAEASAVQQIKVEDDGSNCVCGQSVNKMVLNLANQLQMTEHKLAKAEEKLANTEHQISVCKMRNVELSLQLEDKDIEIEDLKNELEDATLDKSILNNRLADKTVKLEKIEEILEDDKNILMMIKNEVNILASLAEERKSDVVMYNAIVSLRGLINGL